jgi:hypothetical protein
MKKKNIAFDQRYNEKNTEMLIKREALESEIISAHYLNQYNFIL